MKEWVVLFCIVACVFAAFAIVYVIASVIHEKHKRDCRGKCVMAMPSCPASKDRYLTTAMLCGTVFAVSGLLVWSMLSKERTSSGSRVCRVAGRRNRRY